MKLWFNHWFSTVYNIITSIKEECKEELIIVGSNEKKDAVYKVLCDEWYQEPVFKEGEKYATWCLNFCKTHQIDVFIPRRGRKDIAKIYNEFQKNGVKVLMCSNYELMQKLESKIETAKIFRENQICEVPEMITVTNVHDFKKAYEYLSKKYPEDRICFKYEEDEGGLSFRVIDNTIDTIKTLRNGRGLKITYSETISMLSKQDKFDSLILMIYLKGPEISIDSLMTSKGFVGAVREKKGSRVTEIYQDKDIIGISEKFARLTGITMPYNLQLRYHNNKLYLLEVNTRMAGGIHKLCLAGINIPYIALCELLGNDFEFPMNISDKVTISQIETPILLK